MMRGTPEFARDPAALPGALAWFGGERNPLFEPEPGDGDPGGASPLVALGVGAAATPPSARAPPPAAAPEAALRKARAGGLLTKLPYGSAASGAKIRFFRVVVAAAAAPDAAELQWGDPKDAAASTLGSRLALRDVAAVSRGHATRTFERHANALGAASLGDPASAFSLRCPGRTLDLVAPNARDADAWATALDHLAARAREARAIADANANLPKKIPPTQIPPASTPGGGPPRTPPARPSEGFGGGALDPSPAPVPSPAPATLAARASASVSASVSASAPSPGSRASSPAVFTPAPARASASLSSLSRQGSLDRESASSAAPGAPSPDPRRRPGADAAAAFVPVASRPPPVRGEGHVALDLSDEAARRGGGGEYRGRGAGSGALGSIRRFANRGGGGDPIRAADASVATKEAPPLKNSEAATKPPPLPSSPPRRFGAGDLGEGDDDARRLHALTLEAFSRARHGRTKELDALFARGVDPASRDANGLTLLHMAAQNNQRKAAKLVLKRTDFARHPPRLELIDAQTNRGQTPLHFCFAYGYADLGRYLLSLGADDAIVNVHGMTCYEGLDPDEPPREGLDTPEMRERALRVRERRRLERARPGTETGFPTAFPGANPNRSAGFATDRGAYAHGGGGRRGGAGGEEEEERFRGPAAAAPRAGAGFEGYYGGGYRGGGGGGFATDRGYYGGGYGGAEGGVGGGVGGGGVSPGPPGSADFAAGGAPSPLAYAPPGYSPAAAPGWGGAGYPMVVADPMAAQAAQAMVAQQQAMAMAMAAQAQAQAQAARAMGGAAGGAEAFDFARPASPPSPLLGRRGASAAESAWDRAAAKVPASKVASEGSESRSRSRRSDAARGAAARGPSRGGRSGGRDDDDDDDSSNLDSSSDDDSSNRDASAKSAPRAKESAGRGKGAPGAARRGGLEGGSSAAASYSERRRARRTRAGTDAALKALDAAKVSAAARVAAEARAARRAFAGDGDGRRATRAAGDGAGAGEAARLDRRSARAARTEELDRAAAMRAAAMRAAGFHSSESDDVSSASEAERSGSRSGAFLRGGGGGGALPPEPTRFDERRFDERRFDERRFASLALDAAKDEDDAAKRKDAAAAKEGSDASAPASASAKEGSDASASASKEEKDSSVSSAYSRRRENRLRRAAEKEHSHGGLPAPSPRDAGVSGAAQGARTALPARVASKATLVLGATRLGPRAIRAALERGDLPPGGEGEDARAEAAVEAVRGIRGIMPSPADVAAVRAAWGCGPGMDPRGASSSSDSPGASLPPGVSPADVFFLEMGAVPNCTRRADAFLFALDPAIGSRIRSIRDAFRAFEAAAAEAARSDALAKLVAVAVALVDADRGDDEKNGGAKRNAGSPDDAAPRPSLGAKIDAARALADAEAPAGEKAPGGLLHHLATTARKKSPALLALANETPALVADVLASQPPLARQRAALAELRSACEDARGAVEEDASGSGPFAARVEQGRAARARELDAAAETERRARRAAGEAAARFGVREAGARGGEAEAAVEALAAFARAFAGAARTLA